MSEIKLGYEGKPEDYFGHSRREILPLFPAHASRVLEIGCGAGDTLAWLKHIGRCDWVGGVELFHDAAEIAKGKFDFVQEGNIEQIELPFEADFFDVILCLDVLEHLVDPWLVIRRLHLLLKPGGVLICSIPNVRHHSVVLPLLFFCRWQYSKEGILDRTHLRFFSKKSAVELVECSGLRVDAVNSKSAKAWSKSAIVNFLCLTLFQSFFEFQYLVRAIKTDNS